jgi:hypothetical protein
LRPGNAKRRNLAERGHGVGKDLLGRLGGLVTRNRRRRAGTQGSEGEHDDETAQADHGGHSSRSRGEKYEADSPEAIRAHAQAADLPVDEVVSIADTVVVRADPEPATG